MVDGGKRRSPCSATLLRSGWWDGCIFCRGEQAEASSLRGPKSRSEARSALYTRLLRADIRGGAADTAARLGEPSAGRGDRQQLASQEAAVVGGSVGGAHEGGGVVSRRAPPAPTPRARPPTKSEPPPAAQSNFSHGPLGSRPPSPRSHLRGQSRATREQPHPQAALQGASNDLLHLKKGRDCASRNCLLLRPRGCRREEISRCVLGRATLGCG